MMSVIGQRVLILCIFIIFALLHVTCARYRRIYPYKLDLQESEDSTTARPKSSKAELLIVRLMDVLNKKQDDIINKTRNRCLRLFGSIYGTRDEKLRCLEKLKKNRAEKNRLRALLKNNNLLAAVYKTSFTDFTRVSEDYAGLGLQALKSALLEPKGNVRFSKDYIDFSDLRTLDRKKQTKRDALTYVDHPKAKDSFSTDYIDFAELRARPDKPSLSNMNSYRKSPHSNSQKKKPPVRFRYSSSSEETPDVKKTVFIKWLKPKRFQVIRNTKDVVNPATIDTSEEETVPWDATKEDLKNKNTFKKVEKKAKHKKSNKKQVVSDDDEKDDDSDSALIKDNASDREDYEEYAKSSSSIEYTEPIKTFDKLETYLQGNRLWRVKTRNGRKRMRGFLPKRFRWNEDEIDNLGYYWFDGLQGKYALFPSRT